ncbi:DNA polymerase III subunit delta [Enterococcus asini]|uniref:DNA polymerase III subunit delta n=1 Tax=Enterococcus asini TaxID=57732 RepID=UPI002891B877|nr:DNA polymerase III subunit delta [Enterococcus asini]MDT2757056.1 DNA polymerase III subunit delta [Enterococcus asini]
MDTQSALQAIKEETLAPIYLVFGTENYLIDKIKAAFLNRLQLQKDDLDLVFFDMEEDLVNVAVAEAEALPLFSVEDKRLVFVENCFFLTAEKKTNLPEHDFTDLLAYLNHPSETAVMVFFAPYEKLDERKKITKALKKQAVLIEAQPLSEKAAEDYIKRSVEASGLVMDRQTLALFIQLTDLDITKSMNELNKLQLYAGAKKEISQSELLALIPKSLDHNLFDLTDHLLQGRTEQALRLYQDLLLQGEETIKLNAVLISQLRLFLQTQILMKLGYQQSNIAKSLGVHPYRIKLAMQQVRKFSPKRLQQLYDRLIENDYLVKTGKMDKELLFELTVLEAADHF